MLPTGRAGRFLALAMVCLVVAAAYLAVIAPLMDFYRGREAALGDKRMLAQRLAGTAAELPRLRAQLADLQAVASTRKITLEGSSDAIASANLQSRLEELATAAGVTIGSTEAVPAENRGTYRRVGLRLAVNGGYASIVKLLGAVDKAAPPLVLSNLQIHATARPVGDASNARLDAGFEVYGFRNSEAAPTPQQ